MQFDNATAKEYVLPDKTVVAASEQNVVVADQVYTDSYEMRDMLGRLLKDGRITIDTPPSGYEVRLDSDGDSVLELTGAPQAGITADITVGAEDGADTINVTVQVQDENGNDVADNRVLRAFLSDAVDGEGVTATAPTTVVSDGTGEVVEHVADKVMSLHTDDAGTVGIDITDAGTSTWYLSVVDPATGDLWVSDPITFA